MIEDYQIKEWIRGSIEKGYTHEEIAFVLIKNNYPDDEIKELLAIQNVSTLSFEIETSNIGTVGVFVAFSGKTVTLQFEFEDKTISTIAKNMQEEIRDGLVSRGFNIKSVDFTVRTSNTGTSDAVSKRTKNLDVLG